MENDQTFKEMAGLTKRSSNYMSLKHMKTLIVLVVGLLAVGCGMQEQATTYEKSTSRSSLKPSTEEPVKELTPEQKQKALRDSVVGEYEGKSGNTSKLVFLENGVLEAYDNGKKHDVDAKWTIKNGEVVITAPMATTAETGGKTKVVNESVRQFSLTIKSNGDLVPKIEDAPQTPNAVNVKREVFTYKKIKPSTPAKPTTKQTTVQPEESAESDDPVQITVLTPETLQRNASGFYIVEIKVLLN